MVLVLGVLIGRLIIPKYSPYKAIKLTQNGVSASKRDLAAIATQLKQTIIATPEMGSTG